MDGDGPGSEETLALLDGLFENAPVGFTYVDRELRYRRVNAMVAALNGGSVDERIGRTIDDVHGEPCGPLFSAVCRDVIRTGRAQQVRIEGRLWHGRGPHQVWRMSYYPVFGREGAVIGVGDVFVDVTEAERIQRELAELSTARQHAVIRYQSLVEATSAAVWTVDPDGTPLPDPLGGAGRESGFLTAVHPDDRPDVERRWHAAVAAGSVYDEVARLHVVGGVFRHFRVRAVPVVVDGRLAGWVGTEADVEAEVRARTRLELLARATEAMNLEPEPVRELQALADVLVPAFADGCAIHLVDPLMPDGPVTGRRLLRRVDAGVVGADIAAETFSYSGEHPFFELTREGRPLLLGHPTADGRGDGHGGHTTLLAPVHSGGAVIAVLAFVARGDRPPFTDEDLTFVGELASRASGALDRAQRFQQTRRAALTLQQAMLTELPERSDVQIQARYQPALAHLEVGGDWYDAFTLPGGDLGLVVGDVVGHDLRAATVMGQLRSMFRGIAMDDDVDPPAAVERLNELTIALEITDFTTLVYARLRADPAGGGTVTWCSAGHPPMMMVSPVRGSHSLTSGSGMALGIRASDVPRCAGHARVDPGATLLLYTDGLVENRTSDLDELTTRLEVLTGQLATEPLPAFCDELLARAAPGNHDDIAILAARFPPVPR